MDLKISKDLGLHLAIEVLVTEPGADWCPQAGSPLGVVDATGTYIQPAIDNFAATKTCRTRLSAGSGRHRSQFCNGAVKRLCLIAFLIAASTCPTAAQTEK